jgi:hypothetical protein
VSGPKRAPVGEEQVRQLAALADIEIAPGHVPGVIRNLEILRAQAALLFEPPLDSATEPATAFRP